VLRKSKHIVCSINIFSENCSFYEIIWKNTVEPERSQMTILRMRISCWLIKVTNTHSEYVILLLYHCNSGCKPAPQFYVIPTLTVSFSFSDSWLSWQDQWQIWYPVFAKGRRRACHILSTQLKNCTLMNLLEIKIHKWPLSIWQRIAWRRE
jgi:hypothetical protein